MRVFGIILIVIGIAMFLFQGFSFTQEKNVVDLGPVEINKKEKKNVSWPTYAGAIVTAVGAFLVFSGKKK
ncbi:hypothetical protein [Flavihumibacter sp. CACIAM 22H1]|uniref:hypothetical protein n=1 Tax=Flavihumibacter sp. CACIAM 22H1 TaxID=1812911 RepID=UPI0007A91B46|nr:hypothetical protein [Flavihumibacter sp. CACIAM 22H1]KYP14661.1 MAG: hypothetical protein A1D16_05045 [Flavihumibacter sp. CACIAM 22H1]